MSAGISVDELYNSAVEFAHTALAAHGEGKARRTALDAGTAIEHLAKASLFQRSPALLVELRNGDLHSLTKLLGLQVLRPPKRVQVRTIGLREAVARAEQFIDHRARTEDLTALYDLRDGVAHAAAGAKIRLQRVVAFVVLADALLADLARPREAFWQGHLETVEELLNRARTDAEHEVGVAKAAARKRFIDKFGDVPEEPRKPLIGALEDLIVSDIEDMLECPVCHSTGKALGAADVLWGDVLEYDDETDRAIHSGHVTSQAASFSCPVRGLRLPTEQHMTAAGLDWMWEIRDGDPYDYEPEGPEYFDSADDELYDAWRDYQLEKNEEPEI